MEKAALPLLTARVAATATEMRLGGVGHIELIPYPGALANPRDEPERETKKKHRGGRNRDVAPFPSF